MANARRGRKRRASLLARLPSTEESAAAIQAAARKLGLLIDLHQITQRLRADEPNRSRPSS